MTHIENSKLLTESMQILLENGLEGMDRFFHCCSMRQ